MWAMGEEQWQSSIRGMGRPGKTKRWEQVKMFTPTGLDQH